MKDYKEVGSSKEVNENSKRSDKEVIWQEKMKPTRIEGRKQCAVGSKKYSLKQILKKAGTEKI